MAVLARIDPLTYAVDALRAIVYGRSPLARALVVHPYGLNLAVIGAFLLATFGLALATFGSRDE